MGMWIFWQSSESLLASEISCEEPSFGIWAHPRDMKKHITVRVSEIIAQNSCLLIFDAYQGGAEDGCDFSIGAVDRSRFQKRALIHVGM
jgi:hypothetical protein